MKVVYLKNGSNRFYDSIDELIDDIANIKGIVFNNTSPLTKEEAVKLFKAIKENGGIQFLNFNNYKFSDDVLAELLTALELDINIEEVFLDNALDLIEANSLLEAIKDNKTLKKLTLNNIDLDDKFIDKLAHMLEKNKTLEEIELEGNKVDKPLLNLVKARLVSNKKDINLTNSYLDIIFQDIEDLQKATSNALKSTIIDHESGPEEETKLNFNPTVVPNRPAPVVVTNNSGVFKYAKPAAFLAASFAAYLYFNGDVSALIKTIFTVMAFTTTHYYLMSSQNRNIPAPLAAARNSAGTNSTNVAGSSYRGISEKKEIDGQSMTTPSK